MRRLTKNIANSCTVNCQAVRTLNQVVTARVDRSKNVRTELVGRIARHDAVGNRHRAIVANCTTGDSCAVAAERAVADRYRTAATNGTAVVAGDVAGERTFRDCQVPSKKVCDRSRIIEGTVSTERRSNDRQRPEVGNRSAGTSISTVDDSQSFQCQISAIIDSENPVDVVSADCQ